MWLSDRRAARHGGLWQLGGNTANCNRGRAYTLYTSGSGTKSERKKKRAAAENRTGPGFSYDVEYAYWPQPPWRYCKGRVPTLAVLEYEHLHIHGNGLGVYNEIREQLYNHGVSIWSEYIQLEDLQSIALEFTQRNGFLFSVLPVHYSGGGRGFPARCPRQLCKPYLRGIVLCLCFRCGDPERQSAVQPISSRRLQPVYSGLCEPTVCPF